MLTAARWRFLVAAGVVLLATGCAQPEMAAPTVPTAMERIMAAPRPAWCEREPRGDLVEYEFGGFSVLTRPGPRDVVFPTRDGGLVYADLYGQGERAVVLAHGGRFDKSSWAEQAPILVEAGFQVLAIDFRGRGESHGGPQPGSDDDVRFDVLAAIDYLHEGGATSVSVVGASFGGWATAQAAVEAEPGAIDRLVLMAAPGIDDPERMQGRKLFITTREDASGGGHLRLPSIREQYERAPEPKRLVILEGAAHAQHVFKSEQAERMMREILDFLSEP